MRRMEEIRYDDLSGAKLDAPMVKTIVWDGVVYQFDLDAESNTKLDETMKEYLAMATVVEVDDLSIPVGEGIGGGKWHDENVATITFVSEDNHSFGPADVTPPTPHEAGKGNNEGKGPRRSLTDDQVRAIRLNTGISAKELAEKYNVSVPVIYSVRNRSAYKDVK
jgi:hypothetical protein